jgi:hypothetical protein
VFCQAHFNLLHDKLQAQIAQEKQASISKAAIAVQGHFEIRFALPA